MVTSRRLSRRRWLALAAAGVLSGCGTMGPPSVQRDRADYAEVLGRTWKEQTLMNVVKLRYADVPVYLEVASIISSTSLEGQVNMAATNFDRLSTGNNQLIGGYGRYTDRPTITYSPVGGERFARYLLRPLSPTAVFGLVQGGYAVDRVLQLTTRAINGVSNRSAATGRARAADPEFPALMEAMRRVQRSESMGTRVERRGGDEVATLFFRPDPPADVADDMRTVQRLLGLRTGARDLSLIFGPVPRNDSEIALLTRSMAEILLEIAATIEAPEADVREGRAQPAPPPATEPPPWGEPLVRIHSSPHRVDDAFASVLYRGHWFWIDDRDLTTKRNFALLMLLFSLADTGEKKGVPLLTIPTQ